MIPEKFTWQNAIARCKNVSGKLKDFKFDDFCKTNYTNLKAWFGFGTLTSEEDYMKHSGKIRVTYAFFPSNWQCSGKCFISLYTYIFTKSTTFRVLLSKLCKIFDQWNVHL